MEMIFIYFFAKGRLRDGEKAQTRFIWPLSYLLGRSKTYEYHKFSNHLGEPYYKVGGFRLSKLTFQTRDLHVNLGTTGASLLSKLLVTQALI